MKTVLEIAAGLTLAGAFSVGMLTLIAFELGRAFSRADEQREVAPARARVRRAV